MLDTNELERLTLRTRKAVALLVVGESVLVIWVFEAKPTFPISDCGCPKNPPSFTTVMVAASTNAINYPIGLTNPSLGAVN